MTALIFVLLCFWSLYAIGFLDACLLLLGNHTSFELVLVLPELTEELAFRNSVVEP
jgi:hypothetical protein